MSKQLIECVPNFSEGRDMSIIKQIIDQIESVEGVKLLDVDPGKATNRTVVTFVGEPQPVIKAAFLAIKKAPPALGERSFPTMIIEQRNYACLDGGTSFADFSAIR